MKLVPFEGNLPQAPKSVTVKSAQRLRPGAGGGYFAVRYIFEEPTTLEIKAGRKIFPIPEFGAMAYNWELHGLLAFEWNLSEPVDEGGIKAWHRAEVWRTHNDQPTQLAEVWFASEVPGGTSFVQFIMECIEAEQKQTQAELAKLAPKPIQSIKQASSSDENVLIDHRRNVRDVCERLLRREYPQTFRAMDQKACEEEVRKAFIADNISNTGIAPEAEGLEKLFRDPSFIDWLARALDKRGHKVPSEEWTLACGWVKWGFYRLSEGELEKELNKRTGLNLKGDSWRRRADRLGLIRARNPGRPEKPNLLPPVL